MKPSPHISRVFLILLLVLLGGCDIGASGTPTPAARLTVFAASSLSEAVNGLATGWAAKAGGGAIQPNFGGSQALLAQLQQGAHADLFLSADKPTMDTAVTAGLVEAPRELARNSLVVVLPHDNPGRVNGIADLARPGLKIVLAAPSVPVGNYTTKMLDKLEAVPAYGSGFKQKVEANVVSQEDNVRSVLSKVQLGEADAGVVYSTDARTAATGAQAVKTLSVPAQYNVVAVYFIAVLNAAPQPVAARSFLDYAVSGDGQAVMAKYGFLPAQASPASPPPVTAAP